MHTVAMFAFPQAQILDITGPLEVFSRASRWMVEQGIRATPAYRVRLLAQQAGALVSSSGLSLMAEDWRQAPAADTVLIAGGIGWASVLDDAESCDWIRAQSESASRLGSICTGALLLARLGLLDGHAATTHWAHCDALDTANIDVRPDDIFVRSGRLYTSAGVTAGIDMALAMVEDDHGSAVALAVARQLVLYLKRPGHQAQFSSPLATQTRADSPLSRLDLWLREHLAAPITVPMMAAQAHMSPRNFSRVFTKEFGCGPGAWLRRLRLDRARELLEQSDLDLSQVAAATGLGSDDSLRRAFQQRFGTPPSVYRSHFRCAG